MNNREQALAITLKQIDAIKWDAPDERSDMATELLLYMMEKNAALVQALERAISLIGHPEARAELAAILASCDTRPKGGDSTQIEAPFTSGAVPEADAQPF
jgi:hypothetical protein